MVIGVAAIEEHALAAAGVGARATEEACGRIPPLWPLENFVAVNPFLGLSDLSFDEAGILMERVTHATPLMEADYYLNKIRNGSISASNIRVALQRWGSGVEPSDPISWLELRLRRGSLSERILTVADWLDEKTGTSWAPFVVDEISKWCSSYFDRGQSTWRMPWKHLSLYEAWRRAAEIDANPEVAGLAHFRRHVKELPQMEDDAIAYCMERLDIPAELAQDFLHRELMTVFGWSAYAAYQDRQGLGHNTVRQILAIRLAYDTALLPLCDMWQCRMSTPSAGSTEARHIAQLALEHVFESKLLEKLRERPAGLPSTSRKSLQAVFCIDVRSELYRRALEAQGSGIETLGFAGFFGMPIEVASSARCPVLLSPGYRVEAEGSASVLGQFGKQASELWTNLTSSAAACFSSVEVGGALSGLGMLGKSWARSNGKTPAENLRWDIPLPERVQLAAGALRNMGLEASRLAPVVLLCGHGSRTENNPYASSLDCGACGGHKGDINARFAAALLNDPEVRQGLKQRGMPIPMDTVFVGALHNTTTDEVALYDSEDLLSVEQRAQVERWLRSASEAARRERARNFLPAGPAAGDLQLEKEVLQRSRDWSEVRPEWGLAGNAAFIAAPRSRTRHLNLEGRVFLHEYDPLADHDGSVLRLILTAPVVVASWINLQYFASTVNNRVFGSGNKVLHNVTGTFGVWEGNGGDLRTGLPLQSLHDGEQWMHEPLRLHVFVEAPLERIDRILRDSTEVRNLVEHRWIHLLAMDGASCYECRGTGKWRFVSECAR